MAHTLPQRLRVLSYNVNMLPGVIGRGKTDLVRAERIAAAISDASVGFDLVCLQEVFTETSRAILREGLTSRFPHQVARCCPPHRFWTPSGLFFASRFPIVSEPRFAMFREYAALSSDFFAMKGVFGVKVDIEGTTLCAFNTHLQSMPLWRNQRLGQVEQIRRFVLEELDGTSADETAAVLCGDMNIPGESRSVAAIAAHAIHAAHAADAAHAGGLADEKHGSRGASGSHEVHGVSAIGVPTAEYLAMRDRLGTATDVFREAQTDDPGFTWDGAENALIPRFPASEGAPQRLDYLFAFTTAPDPSSPTRLRSIRGDEASVEMFGPDRRSRLSDHFGVAASLILE